MTAGWGERIKKARGEQKQMVFAAQIGVGTTMLSEYEREITMPRLDTLRAIHAITGVSPNAIVLGEFAPGPTPVDFEILQAAIESVETDAPNIPAESKAKLVISLYKDRVSVKHKENTINPGAVSDVRRGKRVQGNSRYGGE
jgi:transcriptional regulator with XRE-family HTH domain